MLFRVVLLEAMTRDRPRQSIRVQWSEHILFGGWDGLGSRTYKALIMSALYIVAICE